MAIYYHQSYSKIRGTRNFGDDINPVLLGSLFQPQIVASERVCIVGIGTILNDRELQRVAHYERKVVFSSGVGYGSLDLEQFDESWDIACVRGTLSANALGIPSEKAICDGAILLNTMFPPSSRGARGEALFIPHISTHHKIGVDLQRLCARADVGYLAPDAEFESFVQGVQSARLVIAEAMHGAILADAMRVPWIPAKLMVHEPFKWKDWFSSIDLEYHCVDLSPPFWPESTSQPSLAAKASGYYQRVKQELFRFRVAKLRKSADAVLSTDSTIEDRRAALREVAAEVNKTYRDW